ncbi:MAG: hypothetical protein FWC13_10080 [Oscillospiraceae bacterium]|nr:hypothetical protein [Oscillospiraceae bacterium]
MRSIKKKLHIVLLLAAASTMLLTGCIQVNVNIGITDDFTAYLTYEISVVLRDETLEHEMQLRNAINQIAWHYQEELGFTVSSQTESSPFTLTMIRMVPNNSLAQAFSSLEEMLTDESMSIFMQVDTVFESFYRQDRYLLRAMVDIPQILRMSNINELPLSVAEQLNQSIEYGDGLISLSFPASEVLASTHPVSPIVREVTGDATANRAEMLVLMDFSGQTEFGVEARVNYLRDGTIGAELDEIIAQQQQLTNISVLVSGAALLLMLITLIAAIVRAVRMRRD